MTQEPVLLALPYVEHVQARDLYQPLSQKTVQSIAQTAPIWRLHEFRLDIERALANAKAAARASSVSRSMAVNKREKHTRIQNENQILKAVRWAEADLKYLNALIREAGLKDRKLMFLQVAKELLPSDVLTRIEQEVAARLEMPT